MASDTLIRDLRTLNQTTGVRLLKENPQDALLSVSEQEARKAEELRLHTESPAAITPDQAVSEVQYREIVQDAIRAKIKELSERGIVFNAKRGKAELKAAIAEAVQVSLIAHGLAQFLQSGAEGQQRTANLPGMLGSTHWLQTALNSGKIPVEMVQALRDQIPQAWVERINAAVAKEVEANWVALVTEFRDDPDAHKVSEKISESLSQRAMWVHLESTVRNTLPSDQIYWERRLKGDVALCMKMLPRSLPTDPAERQKALTEFLATVKDKAAGIALLEAANFDPEQNHLDEFLLRLEEQMGERFGYAAVEDIRQGLGDLRNLLAEIHQQVLELRSQLQNGSPADKEKFLRLLEKIRSEVDQWLADQEGKIVSLTPEERREGFDDCVRRGVEGVVADGTFTKAEEKHFEESYFAADAVDERREIFRKIDVLVERFTAVFGALLQSFSALLLEHEFKMLERRAQDRAERVEIDRQEIARLRLQDDVRKHDQVRFENLKMKSAG